MFRWWTKRKPQRARCIDVVSTFVFSPAERKKTPMQETSITTVQKQRVQIKHRRRGAPAGELLEVSGVPTWEGYDNNIVTVEPEADGKAATVFANAPGETIITNVSQVIKPDGTIVEIVSQFKVTVNEDGTIESIYEFDPATDK